VVMTRVLADHDELHTPAGHMAVGWTIVEDLITVLILVLLPAVVPAAGGPEHGSLLLSLGIAFLKIAVLLVVLFLVGTRVIPWLLKHVAATRSRELFTLTILAVALGIALGASSLFGVSMALGAFLAGMVVGRSDFSLRAATEALPMRDAFAVLFFVSVGMLFDPRAVAAAPWLTAATVAIVILGKPLVSFLLVRVLGQPSRTALSVGLALGQVGEFSFILAGVGNTLGLLPLQATSALVVAAIVSIALSPLLRKLVEPFDALARRARKRVAATRTGDLAIDGGAVEGAADPAMAATVLADPAAAARYRAVVVGYGPIGRTVSRLLAENGVTCTIVEMNLQTVHRLRSQGMAVVYGDASHAETLRRAGVQRAGSLVVSAAGAGALAEVIRVARELNQDIRILARTAFLRERAALRSAGADLVFSGEGEVALAMNEAVLEDMGAERQAIIRERDRLRADLQRDMPEL